MIFHKNFYSSRTAVELDIFPKTSLEKPFSIVADAYRTNDDYGVEHSTLDMSIVLFNNRLNLFVRVVK